MQNSKKSIANVFAAFVSQLVTLGLGIIIPRLVLVNLGSEANGLLSSVNTILGYVSLLEAGVGVASTQALYGPIAKDNRDDINSILAATNIFYRRTSRWYFAIVLLLTFVFPFTIQSALPSWQIMLFTFLSGMPGAISFYFQGKYQILLRAEGKSYVLTNLTTICHIGTSFAKIILLLCGCNIVALQCMYMAFNLIQVAYIMLCFGTNIQYRS